MKQPDPVWRWPAMLAGIGLFVSCGRTSLAQTADVRPGPEGKVAKSQAALPTGARLAVMRAVPLIQKAAASYPKNRSCFSCHHQTLPMLAMVAARAQGLSVDEKLLQAQAAFTQKWVQAAGENLKQAQGIG